MKRKRKPAAGVALVLGSGAGVWQEIAAAQALGEFRGVVACNEMISHWPGALSAAVSLHPEKMPGWLEARKEAGHPPVEKTAVHAEWRDWYRHIGRPETLPFTPDLVTPYRFDGQTDSGTSGLFALKVALVDLGFDKAICCGMPMTTEAGHFTMATYQPWFGALTHRKGWQQAMPEIAGRARAMSGWTADLLGRPDATWFA